MLIMTPNVLSSPFSITTYHEYRLARGHHPQLYQPISHLVFEIPRSWLVGWLWVANLLVMDDFCNHRASQHSKTSPEAKLPMNGFITWFQWMKESNTQQLPNEGSYFLVNQILKIFRTTWEQSLGFILRSPDTLMKFAPCRKARVRAKRHCTTTWNEVPQSHGGILFHMLTTFLQWMLSTKHFENKIDIYRKTMF